VRQIETDLGMVFADVAFANLVLYLALAIRRLQLGKNINMPTVDLDSLKSSLHFEVVENVTKALSERLRIAIPEAEVGYLTQHVLASGVLSNEKSEVSIDLQLAVCNLIGAVGQRLGTVLTSDQQLFEGLTSHIGPAMQRLGRGFVVSNPYLHELRTNHQVMYEVVAECATAAFGSHGVSLPQEEIGFLTLHFGAALERRLLAQAMPAVLVVCGTGVGTASLLSSRLRSNFILKIVGLVAAHKVNELLKSTQVDLIVSTVPLADVEVKTVLVSPFLTPKDVNELRAVLDDRRSPNLSLEDVLQIIGKHCTILDRQGLVRELIRYSSELDVGNKMRADQPLLHLQDALTREYVSIGNTAARWEDAVTIAGTLLVSSGAVELVYVANMIAAIRQFGPYVVIAPGVALPHASSAEGVNKVAISCLRLSTPVVFGHPQNDPVDLLFCFATPDKVSHQLILQELGRLLADAATVKKLRKARSVAAFLNVVREFAQ
jgi:mannitol/fructose-specific phosphotransferase system IIA component (Ntr-type)/transcriptional regulatory protein LevR